MDEPAIWFHKEKKFKFGAPCANCFPHAVTKEAESYGVQNKYIDLFDFPKFDGFKNLSKLESYDTSNLSFSWFADVVYTLKTPIPHKYNSVYNFVLESKRFVSVLCVKLYFCA